MCLDGGTYSTRFPRATKTPHSPTPQPACGRQSEATRFNRGPRRALPLRSLGWWNAGYAQPRTPECHRHDRFANSPNRVRASAARGSLLHNPQPATDAFRLSHPTVTGALSQPPPLREHSPRGEGVVSLASVRAHFVDRKRLFDISEYPAAAAGAAHACMECMTQFCHTSM